MRCHRLDAAGSIVAFSEGASTLLKLPRERCSAGLFPSRDAEHQRAGLPRAVPRRRPAGAPSTSDSSTCSAACRSPCGPRCGCSTALYDGSPVTWLRIDALESLGFGPSREAVVSAISRRVRAEPVDRACANGSRSTSPARSSPRRPRGGRRGDAARHRFPRPTSRRSSTRPSRRCSAARWVTSSRPPLSKSCGRGSRAAPWTTVAPCAAGALPRPVRGRATSRWPTSMDRLIIEIEREPDVAPTISTSRARPTPNLPSPGCARPRRSRDRPGRRPGDPRPDGFEAVLVYRFDADWNGEAVGEDKTSIGPAACSACASPPRTSRPRPAPSTPRPRAAS